MKLVVGLRPGVLHGHLRAELDVGVNRLPELFMAGKARPVHYRHVELDKPLSPLLGDLEVPVNVDEVGEAELSTEAVRTSEGLGGEGGEVVDMLGLAGTEERLE